MLKKIIRDQEGSVFIVTLMILAVLSILGSAVLSTTFSNNKMAIYDSEFQSVYYVAEAGVRHVGSSITDSIEDIYRESESKTEYFNKIEGCITDAIESFNSGDFSEVRGSQPGVDIILENVESTDDSRIYTLISTGDIDGISRRVVQKIEVKYSKSNGILADKAVFADKEINLIGSGMIIGDVGTNLTSPKAINISGGLGGNGIRIDGDCYLPEGASEEAISVTQDITKPNMKTTPKRNLILPEFPEFPSFSKLDPITIAADGGPYYLINDQGDITVDWWVDDGYVLELNRNAYIPEIDIRGKLLTIKVDNDVDILVDSITIENDGHLKLIGNGKVTLYVKNTINLGGGVLLNEKSEGETENQAIEQLTIYYKGTEKLTVGDGAKVYASIYAETAQVQLTGGSGYMGHIFTGSTEQLEIINNADTHSRIICAPYAPVICTGRVKGSIICKSIEVSGSGKIEFVASDKMADIPFEVKNPGEQNLLKIDPIRER